MKMTKQFEKKLKALADKMGLDTNFDWDLGWFDFLSKDYIKLGSVRFYGYGMTTNRQLQIYVATAYTRKFVITKMVQNGMVLAGLLHRIGF